MNGCRALPLSFCGNLGVDPGWAIALGPYHGPLWSVYLGLGGPPLDGLLLSSPLGTCWAPIVESWRALPLGPGQLFSNSIVGDGKVPFS